MQGTTTTNEELARAQSQLQGICDVAVISYPAHLIYVSGFEPPPNIGVVEATAYAPPFAAIPVAETGGVIAASTFEAPLAERQSRLSGVLAFDAFDFFHPTDARSSYLQAVTAALKEIGLRGGGTVGIESGYLPFAAGEAITAAFPGVKLVDIHGAIVRARMIKTAREIDLLRKVIEIGAVGQRTLARLVQTAGQNEFDMWNTIVDEMSKAAGKQVPVVGELVTGERTTTVSPGGPAHRVTAPGDPVLMDISERLNGYWSDCTNSHLVGGVEPGEEVKRLARTAQGAFEALVETLRPGKQASDAWAAAEAVYHKNGMEPAHYMGHQLGATVNELPRIVPYDHTPIEAGMVFALEPGAYEGPGGKRGVRFEKNLIIHDSGPEIVSAFDWGISI